MPDPSACCKIIQASEATEQLYQACQRLVPQMTTNNPPPTRDQLQRMFSSGTSTLFVAYAETAEGDEIIGLGTLIVYHVPTGLRGYIEDVIVDEAYRGRGIGEALTRTCLENAQRAGCPQVMLTCNPDREAANRLYQRMGFVVRKTNVYRYRFTGR
jgi:ribosomal protein S18 acetylase RimI-like enzyme